MVRNICAAVIVLLLFFSPSLSAGELLYFYEKGCPDCKKINDFLENRIKPNYAVIIREYEIHESGNASLLIELARIYGAEDILAKGTPAIFIGDEAFQGSSRLVHRKIEEAVRYALTSETESPLSRLQKGEQEGKLATEITLPAVIGSAAVDSVNPCACAVLVLLLGSVLLVSGRKRKAVIASGFAFTAACFLSYFLMGFGLFSAVRVAGIQHYVYIAVAVLAVLFGLWNMKEIFRKGQGISVGVPKSWQPKLKKISSNITSVPGAFFMGFLISLFLLPCTSGPYIVIIGMLGDTATRLQAVWLLLLYNAIFILPFVVITFGVGLGLTTTARVEIWRQKNLARLHFITGFIMFTLGITMFVLLAVGIIR